MAQKFPLFPFRSNNFHFAFSSFRRFFCTLFFGPLSSFLSMTSNAPRSSLCHSKAILKQAIFKFHSTDSFAPFLCICKIDNNYFVSLRLFPSVNFPPATIFNDLLANNYINWSRRIINFPCYNYFPTLQSCRSQYCEFSFPFSPKLHGFVVNYFSNFQSS